MEYSQFQHANVIDCRIEHHQGRKVLIVRTTLTLDEEGDGFDAEAMNDLCVAFAGYVEGHPDISECHLVRVRH